MQKHSLATVEGYMNDTPVYKTINDKKYAWFNISIYHTQRPEDKERRISHLLIECSGKDFLKTLTGYSKNNRLMISGELIQYTDGEENKIKLSCSNPDDMKKLNHIMPESFTAAAEEPEPIEEPEPEEKRFDDGYFIKQENGYLKYFDGKKQGQQGALF